jgi:hypothetical protein
VKKSDRPYIIWRMCGKTRRAYFRINWTEGGKRRAREIRINAAPDTPEFDREYWALRSGISEKLAPPPSKTSWRELVREYRSSVKYRKLAASTRKPYDRVIEEILAKNADKDVASMTRAHIRAIHQKYRDTPRKADWYVQIISLLLNFAAKTLDWEVKNVAEGIELYGKQREFLPWPEWMVAKLPTAPRNVRTAAELILGTGQRPNAAIAMRREHFRGDWMEVLDEKNAERFEVFCPHPLRNYLAELPKSGAYVLAKNLTEPMGYDTVEKAFRGWRMTLGDAAAPFLLHGLRKLAIVRLAEAGCTDAQIQAITNQSAEMVAFYRRQASRKRLSKAAHELGTKRDQNGKE